jgi:hypothetical protein
MTFDEFVIAGLLVGAALTAGIAIGLASFWLLERSRPSIRRGRASAARRRPVPAGAGARPRRADHDADPLDGPPPATGDWPAAWSCHRAAASVRRR